MAHTNITSLNNDDFAVIDLDTGTVLGTNVILVRIPADVDLAEEISNSADAAWEYGTKEGIQLYADLP